jgi:hypothetical protein
MDEIVPGILHWTTFHDGIGQTVHSHVHTPSGAVFDPRLPEAGSAEALSHAVLPTVVLLSSRHHLRHSEAIASAFEVPIKVSPPGLDDLKDEPDVETFSFGEEVVSGVTALELPALAPDETVFHIDGADAGTGALLFGDSLVHHDGVLDYMPDSLMGDDPDEVKRGLTEGLQRILDHADPFDALLFAHGAPIASGGRDALTQFVSSRA